MNPASNIEITCPHCHRALNPPPGSLGSPTETACPHCRSALKVAVFPRSSITTDGSGEASNATPRAQEGEAVCSFYPELQAETVCDECGCLMSRKAAVSWGSQTLCMPCLHKLRENKGADAFSARQVLYDNLALGIVILLFPLSLITGPMALYYLVRHRKKPGGLVPRSSFLWWLALVVSLAVTAGWLFLIVIWIAMMVRAITS